MNEKEKDLSQKQNEEINETNSNEAPPQPSQETPDATHAEEVADTQQPEVKSETEETPETEEIQAKEVTSEDAVKEVKEEEVVKAEEPAEEVVEEVKAEEPDEEVKEVVEEVKDEEPAEEVKEVVEEVKAEEAVEEVKEVVEEVKAEEAVEEVKEAEFDWDEFENDDVSEYGVDERKMLEELYTETLSVIKEHEVVNAKVVNITEKDVVLNIGYKSDGLVPLAEFKYLSDLKAGDEVEVMVESTEGKDGQIILSHRKAIAETAWTNIEKAHETGEIVQGYIKDRTKGGMVVDLFGLDSFLPGSQLDIKPVQDYDAYVGTTMDLKVVKLNTAFRNIVVSHKAIIEQDIEQQRHKILSKLEKGQVLEGIVKNLTSFGVFVDLGGVDGLIHITDVSWGRINHPNEMLEIGQKINVVVLDYDEGKKRISLGMKQLTQHPWETLPAEIVENSILKGKVVNIEDYGAFVEIYPGVEGLVHVSEMTWSQHLKSPSDYVTLNQEMEVKVLSIEREDRKLSLGIKQLTPDPWVKIKSDYEIGSKHKAIVKNITNFGLFVEMEEGIDGLIHISDLSWTKKFNHPSEFTRVGEEIECVILEIDEENRRLSLGHKQIEEDPWETFQSIFEVGSLHEGSISRIDDKGAVAILPYNLEGYCPAKHLHKQDETRPKADEVLEFKVIEFDKSNHKIIISHTQVWKEEQKVKDAGEKVIKKKQTDKTRKALTQVRSKVKKATLGSEFDALQELKDKMTADEKASDAKKKTAKKDDKEKSE